MNLSKNWYFEVNMYCRILAEGYNIPLIKVAGMLSALSPNNKFDQNIKSLENFIIHKGECKVTTFNGQKEKARIILFADDDVNEDTVKLILGGLKTKSFFENIYRPHTSNAVTIDLWQIRWAKKYNVWKADWGSLTPKRYGIISDFIRDKAAARNLLPHQLQALTWTELRGKQY